MRFYVPAACPYTMVPPPCPYTMVPPLYRLDVCPLCGGAHSPKVPAKPLDKHPQRH